MITLEALAALVLEVRDVLEGRVRSPEPPAWCEARGWTSFLAQMDEPSLVRAEQGDLARELASMTGAPASLRALARRVIEATVVPKADAPREVRALRRANERKRTQVAALAALVRARVPGAARIVDFGAGHGHLTRELARELGARALGIEARAHVVAHARRLSQGVEVAFEIADATEVALAAGDLAVGLHACGGLGDALVERASEAGASVLLVSCCPQKIAGPARAPISTRGRALGLTFAREHLGLANLSTLAEGGIDSEGVEDRRRARRAIAILLEEAGITIADGEESRGVHRRQLRKPFVEVVRQAFVYRGADAPPPRAIDAALARAGRENDVMRRLALPRAMLARPLELLLVLDRAARLAEHGAAPIVVEAFDRAASPRNLTIVSA